MWGRWKDKLVDLFYKEIDEEDSETSNKQKKHSLQNNDNLETKVIYQYPENRSFRFPVIPDKVEQNKPAEVPAYQRRKNEHSKRTQQRTNNSSNESKKEETITEKGPFRPTQVPSPIHGFQQRKKEKEVDQVPAFIRKHQTEKTDVEIDLNEKELTTPVEVENKPAETSEYEAQIGTSPEQSNPSTVENRSKPIENRRETRAKKKKEEKKNPIESNSKQPGSLPFNVLMSSNDKRKYNTFKEFAPKTPTNHVESSHEKQNHEETNNGFEIPNHLLNDPTPKNNNDQLWVRDQQELLEKTLKHFNVKAKVVNATQGPAVTRFEVQPEIGVKVSKVKNLSDDLKMNMAARDIRIEAPIPGKNTIGIEIPNQTSQMVGLQEIFQTTAFKNSASPLSIALGLDIEGTPMITNIQKMPHGLIAGATGSGKSVCINTILISLLYKASHKDVKFLLIDPKMVELAPFNEIPHLVSPVITDVKAATIALKWAVSEMEERYEKFVQEGVRDVERFNQKMLKHGRINEKLPFLVIVIDELADLMMVAPQDVEDSICRIAQKARACGMHLLVATQRPSVDVITGLIKANIPTRIAFSVSSQVDSRTIIDTNGAEKLLGKGDMLFVENGSGKSVRIQGAFVSDEEIERVTKHIRSVAPPDYLFEQEQLLEQVMLDEEDEDELLSDAIKFIVKQNGASTSLLQRHFKIGYNRAARLIDTLEMKGIISEQNGSKPREILLTSQQINSNE
ncbi:DNA translocase FtsK [Virgibacillus sp. DJP39]|uniref:DNA translocase FtsK n=1 Tax=Virgibacillus sp. DJP39 TaxID=3409790 RepID=UPI003BB57F89